MPASCNTYPVIILIKSTIAIINIVSLWLSPCFNNIKIPRPAFDNKPAITELNFRLPLINNIVSETEIAQLGIRPNTLVIIGSNPFILWIMLCTNWNYKQTFIKKLSRIVITNINIKILKVCFIG